MTWLLIKQTAGAELTVEMAELTVEIADHHFVEQLGSNFHGSVSPSVSILDSRCRRKCFATFSFMTALPPCLLKRFFPVYCSSHFT